MPSSEQVETALQAMRAEKGCAHACPPGVSPYRRGVCSLSYPTPELDDLIAQTRSGQLTWFRDRMGHYQHGSAETGELVVLNFPFSHVEAELLLPDCRCLKGPKVLVLLNLIQHIEESRQSVD